MTCGKFRRVVEVVVVVVDDKSTSGVNVVAVELVCQLRYQCGLYGKTRARCFTIQIAKRVSRPEPCAAMSHMHEFTVMESPIAY